MLEHGFLVVSLDFELYWGVRDKKTIDEYKENLLGVRDALPRILDLFTKYGIHATWATVGFLFFDSKEELQKGAPVLRPSYHDTSLSPYGSMTGIGANEEVDPYHYAPSLIRKIIGAPHQEVGTHTFSHYYCLEEGQTGEQFKADLKAALWAAQKFGVQPESLIFPRNQFNSEYIGICRDHGIMSYRGNPNHWLYRERNDREETLVRRLFRLVDAYVNFSGHSTAKISEILAQGKPFNIPASRFLRPYSYSLRMLEPLRMRRIKKDMLFAAKKAQVYHLWWHPHNFGRNIDQNLVFLEELLIHYIKLHHKFGMQTVNMKELSQRLVEVFDTNVPL